MTFEHDGQSVAPCVTIGHAPIGPGCPAYVVAEAGVNHNGRLDDALRLVDVAAEAGAQAVKFQVFRAAELTTAGAGVAPYQARCGEARQRDLLARLELSDDQFGQIAAHCRAVGIEFLATPFSPADVDRLMRLGVRAIKIASSDLNNPLLMERAADTDLPLIVSTGAATEEEIRASVYRLRCWELDQRVVLLHCVSSYPTPLEAANLGAIRTLERVFGFPSGYSDHTTSTQIGAWAVAAGARLLEKHVTLDRGAAGPDHAMSLDPPALAEYVATVRRAEAALGSGRLGMSALEADVRAVARRSVVVTRDLSAGTILRSDMLTLKRPAGGIEPDRLDDLLGRELVTDVACDTMLTWDMIR